MQVADADMDMTILKQISVTERSAPPDHKHPQCRPHAVRTADLSGARCVFAAAPQVC